MGIWNTKVAVIQNTFDWNMLQFSDERIEAMVNDNLSAMFFCYASTKSLIISKSLPLCII
jgi:hypothetical protein